jgi:putative MATE family efflux protein
VNHSPTQSTLHSSVQENDSKPEEQVANRPSVSAGTYRGMDLLHGSITSSLWKFATPLIFSFFAQVVYVWIDTFFISHLGPAAISAAGVCEQIMFFTFTLGGGFATGTAIIVARRIGEGRRAEAEHIASQSINATFLSGAVLAIVLYTFLPFLLHLLGLKDDVEMYALAYMSMVLLGLPFNLLIFQTNAIARASGDSPFAMKVLFTSTLLNIAFAPLFIFGYGPVPAMGMHGAGLATAMAIFLSALLSVWRIFSHQSGLHIVFEFALPKWEIVRRVLTLGIPASLQMLCISMTRISIFAIVSSFGLAVTTAYTLGMRMDFIIFMPILGFGIALETITAQNLGAKQPERVMQFYRTAIIQVGSLMMLAGLLLFVCSDYFARLFVQDSTVLSALHGYLSVSVFGYPLFVIGVLSVRLLSGAGKPFVSLGVVVVSFVCVQFPLAYVLAHYTQLASTGIWLGVMGSYCTFAGGSAWFVLRKRWVTAVV